MRPYYEDDCVTLYNASCLDHLDTLGLAEVMVTDPPYGMALCSGRKGGFGDLMVLGDEDTTARDRVVEAWQAIGDRPALVFGRWSIPRPKGTKQVLTWDKGLHVGMGDLKIPRKPNTEEVYVLGTWPDRRGGGVRRKSAVIHVTAPQPSKSHGRLHPTEKPVPLLEVLLAQCPPGTVIDPFCGSAATLRAAKNQGRRAIGFEVLEEYCEVIACRLYQEALPI